MKFLTVIFILFAQLSFAQSDIVREIIDEIEFQEDSIQSVYNWVTDNIRYDVNKLNEIKKGKTYSKNLDFKTQEEYDAHLLKKVIKFNKGVCEDYALLFNAIVTELGYEAKVVIGYTKDLEGKINKSFGHAWNAVYDKGWKLYDPTWGAGYVENERFVKSPNQGWFDVSSEEMLKTHMPYDPIWQLSNEPMTYREFEGKNKTQETIQDFDCEEVLRMINQKGEKEQMKDEVTRSVSLGDGIKLVDDWRVAMLKNISYYGINSKQDLIIEADEKAISTVKLLNEYIEARNRNFKGKKWNIDDAEQKLKVGEIQIESVIEIFGGIEVDDKKIKKAIQKSLDNSNEILEKIREELIYIEEFKSK